MSWVPLLSTASPAGPKGRLVVMTFHRVLERSDPLLPGEPDGERFRAWLLQWVKWFNFIPLSEAVARLNAGTLPERAACITFDDGYADNLNVAAHILSRFGLPGTFFIATNYMDGGMMFNDRVIEAIRSVPAGQLNLEALGLGTWDIQSDASRIQAIDGLLKKVKYLPYADRDAITTLIAASADAKLAKQPMMRPAQVQELARMGFEIGGHTQSHPILRQIPDLEAQREISNSRTILQALTGQKVELFAYPNGRPNEDYDLRHAAMAKAAGYSCAVSTFAGAARQGDDLFQIPRFTPWAGASWKSGLQFYRNYFAKSAALTPDAP